MVNLNNLTHKKEFSDAKSAFDYISEIYNKSCDVINGAFSKLLSTGHHDEESLKRATYPFVGFKVTNKDLISDCRFSFGVVEDPGYYGGTVTRPDLFKEYYLEQLGLLIERYKIKIEVAYSDVLIPMNFVIDHIPIELTPEQKYQLKNGFVVPNLSRIDDRIANCEISSNESGYYPISLFTAERVDFSINRLHHYTGTDPKHFQSFILLTNYQRYVKPFIEYCREQLRNDPECVALVGPADRILATKESPDMLLTDDDLSPHHQMPTYHLVRKDGKGVTFMNIGVGPSNAKTITDHLAVLRPDCWLMVGHCAGLRSTQMLGDYVLAHAYVREDHVLDNDLPKWVPLPAIAEVQVALQEATSNITKESGLDLKARMRTGTVLTTMNRNWELQERALSERFKQSRAIAVDMESATIAGNGFRFRVPYGTLLCISDKPIHGEIKLQGMANSFYRQSLQQHLKVGLEAFEILRKTADSKLHSRKLRGFKEPPFR